MTPRQLQILRMIADGHTNKAIAHQLGDLSPWTVNEHLKHILANLGVCTRAHAVAKAMREGLIK